MTSFKLRRSDGGSALRDSTNATLRGLDQFVQTRRLDINSSLGLELRPKPSLLINLVAVLGVTRVSSIIKSLQISSTESVALSNLSSRFLSLSILSSFTTSLNKFVNKFLLILSSFNLKVSKVIFKTLSNSLLIATNISKTLKKILLLQDNFSLTFTRLIKLNFNITSSLVSIISRKMLIALNKLSTLTPVIQKRTTRSLSIILERLFFTDIIEGGLSNTGEFAESLDALSGSSMIDGSPTPNSAIFKEIKFRISLTEQYLIAITRTSNRFISFTLSSLFSSTIQNKTKKLINLVEPLSNYINKTTKNTINLIENFNSTVSSRLSLFKTLFIPQSAGNWIVPQSQSNVNKFTSITSQYIVNLTKLMKKLFNLTIDLITIAINDGKSSYMAYLMVSALFTNSVNKLTFKTINANINDSLNFKKLINTSNNATTLLVSAVYWNTQKLISLTITELFTANSFKNTALSLTSSYYFTVNFVKNVGKSIFVSFDNAIQIVTLSLRQVSLAILTSFQSSVTKSINLLVNFINLFVTNFVKSIESTLNVLMTSTLAIIKSSQNTISVLTNNTSRFSLTTFKGIYSSEEFSPFVYTRKFVSQLLETTFTVTTNIVFLTSRLVSLTLSSLFTTYRQANISTSIINLLSAVSNTVKTVGITINTTLNNFIFLLIQSLRFVSINILNSFESSFKKSINYSMNSTFNTINIFNKLFFNTISTALSFTFNISKNTTKTIYTNFTNIIRSSLNFYKNISSTFTVDVLINQINALLIDLNVVVENFVSLTRQSISSFNITASISTNNLINKSIKTNINLLRNFNTMLFNQSFRFISLSIINNFSITNFNKTISYQLSIISNSAISLFKNIFKLILQPFELLNEFSKNIIRLVSVNLVTLTSFRTNVSKIFYSSIELISQVIFRSLRFVSFAISNLMSTQRLVLTNLQLSINFNLLTNIRKNIDILINRSIVLSNKIIKNTSQIFNVTSYYISQSSLRIVIILNNTINFSIIFVTQTLRFVTLALVNLFGVNTPRSLQKSLTTTFFVINNVRFNKVFFRALEVFVNLPTRRSHILYSTLTKFAVNKSTPGSDGSAQTTQRQSGGSARKRNIGNSGSTLFRRGKTNDLE